MSNYELFDIGVKCAGLVVVMLLLALLLVPPIMRHRDEDEVNDETQHDGH